MTDNELAPIIMGKLLNIGGMLQKKSNQLLAPFDLNQQQFSILFSIFKEGKVRQKFMVNRLLLEKAHVSKVVKKLNKMELIDIIPSKEDKRSSWLVITEKGIKTVKECQILFLKWNSDWIKEISDNKKETLLNNLTTIQGLFKDKIQN